MSRLFPNHPSLPDHLYIPGPAQQWIAPATLRSDHYSVYKKLPAGKPDCLRVDVVQLEDGTERCTAAVYGERVYVIHYEFKAHVRS